MKSMKTLITGLLALLMVSVLSHPARAGNLVAQAKNIDDFQIGATNWLDASGSTTGEGVTYAWTVVEPWARYGGNEDPDHHNEDIVTNATTPISTIPMNFFDVEDVGTWTVRLTVSDGADHTATTHMTITNKAFEPGAHFPTNRELDVCEAAPTFLHNPSDSSGVNILPCCPSALLTRSDIEGIRYDPQVSRRGNTRYMQWHVEESLRRLNNLATREGMSLKITTAWEERTNRSPHNEGRALDIIPKQSSLRKIGRLADLAQKAGFHWVYHERNHLHASMKKSPLLEWMDSSGWMNDPVFSNWTNSHLFSQMIAKEWMTNSPFSNLITTWSTNINFEAWLNSVCSREWILGASDWLKTTPWMQSMNEFLRTQLKATERIRNQNFTLPGP